MMSWGDKFLGHYEKLLGEPVGRIAKTFDERAGIVQALFYEDVVPDCVMIATLGVCKLGWGGPSCEVCCLVDSFHREIAEGLLSCLKCVHLHQNQFGWGMTIGGVAETGLRDKWPSHLDGFYISRLINAPDEFAVVENGSAKGIMYSAIPITKGEYKYHDQFGAGRFEELLEKSKVDVAEISRSSVC